VAPRLSTGIQGAALGISPRCPLGPPGVGSRSFPDRSPWASSLG
jgi:hypothetical protein